MKTFLCKTDTDIQLALVYFITEMNAKIEKAVAALDSIDGDGPIPSTKEIAGVTLRIPDPDIKRQIDMSIKFRVEYKEVPYAEDRD